MSRFKRIEIHWLAFIDGAKTAVPRACVAAEHKGRGLIRPAFKDVRTLRFLADGVEIQAVDQLHHLVLISRVSELDLQPVGLLKPLPAFSVEKLLD